MRFPPLSSEHEMSRPRELFWNIKQQSSERPESRPMTFLHVGNDPLTRVLSGSDSRSMSRLFRSQHFQAVWERLDSGSSETRPPHPYTELIKLCILKRREGKLTLNQLYRDLEEKFPFFATSQNGKGWRRIIRRSSIRMGSRAVQCYGILKRSRYRSFGRRSATLRGPCRSEECGRASPKPLRILPKIDSNRQTSVCASRVNAPTL
ncbi:potential forkhead-like transcriptional regulator [Pseudozyma hubeiensis SY62]|uniref:Potential forkhead-like transcriptional regulator n=1 Tax=Pseudozyma hubeiensis (strain SY62) TaxID=1305764 RepID=R9P568_PSEHS|nr:potential forkhead-like transcriptional regulator [Pseudozyma hubeiensis SY62]GAC96454.1 potential forkhead-like transcriptional regulator [Pseudozyma hubeiensis SY62]